MYTNEEILQQPAIAEGAKYSWKTNEEELVRWWLGQSAHAANLVTTQGEHLIILDPGKRNDGPGPDIFGARMVLDDYELSGDVEMHLHARDWFAHHHDEDQQYCKVVLHVILDGEQGPDIPTLKVSQKWLGAGNCIANTRLTEAGLSGTAYKRFLRKSAHLEKLGLEGGGFHPLLLGMIEIIFAGSKRSQKLNHAAVKLGLGGWPDCQEWQGSQQSYPAPMPGDNILDALINHGHLFDSMDWSCSNRVSWRTWDKLLTPLKDLGMTTNQCREWVVNILAPFTGQKWGMALWQSMKVFRHYGFENRILQRTGLSKIVTIADQQGLLAWKKNYCGSGYCMNCPLVQSHQSLTHIN